MAPPETRSPHVSRPGSIARERGEAPRRRACRALRQLTETDTPQSWRRHVGRELGTGRLVLSRLREDSRDVPRPYQVQLPGIVTPDWRGGAFLAVAVCYARAFGSHRDVTV